MKQFVRRRSEGPDTKTDASGEAGFSLIEVLVATTIVAVLSVSAVLSLRLAPGTSPIPKIEDFARGLRYLQAEALFTDRSFAIGFAKAGWEVLVFSEIDNAWYRRDPDLVLAAGDWGRGNEISVQIEGRPIALRAVFPKVPAPDVFLLPSGETTPFKTSLRNAAGQSAACTMHDYGELQCKRGG